MTFYIYYINLFLSLDTSDLSLFLNSGLSRTLSAIFKGFFESKLLM